MQWRSSLQRRAGRSPKAHARNALARVAQNGSSAEKAKVKAEVRNKYPDIGRTLERRLAKRNDH